MFPGSRHVLVYAFGAIYFASATMWGAFMWRGSEYWVAVVLESPSSSAQREPVAE